MVKNIRSASGSSNPASFAELNGELYFNASDGINGAELWKSDGTTTGTVMVKDIYSGFNNGSPNNMNNVNGTLYFQATDAANEQSYGNLMVRQLEQF